MTVAMPETDISVDELEALFNMEAFEHPWQVLVLDDDVNSMDYVVLVFMEYFGLNVEKATLKMFIMMDDQFLPAVLVKKWKNTCGPCMNTNYNLSLKRRDHEFFNSHQRCKSHSSFIQ